MKLIRSGFVALLLFVASPVMAVTIDFSEVPGYHPIITNQYEPQGVIFSGLGSYPNTLFIGAVQEADGHTYSGLTHSIGPTQAEGIRADFINPITSLSLDLFASSSWLYLYSEDRTICTIYDFSSPTWKSHFSGTFDTPVGSFVAVTGNPHDGRIGIDNLTFEAAPVPEPSTALLFGAGCLLAIYFKRKSATE